jgi:hypothetical protein
MTSTITTMARFFDVIEPPSENKSRLPMNIVSLQFSTNMTPAPPHLPVTTGK